MLLRNLDLLSLLIYRLTPKKWATGRREGGKEDKYQIFTLYLWKKKSTLEIQKIEKSIKFNFIVRLNSSGWKTGFSPVHFVIMYFHLWRHNRYTTYAQKDWLIGFTIPFITQKEKVNGWRPFCFCLKYLSWKISDDSDLLCF